MRETLEIVPELVVEELMGIYGVLQGHKDNITGLAWSKDGNFLATACEDQRIRMFAAADRGNPVRVRNFNLVPTGITFGQSSKQLLAILQSELPFSSIMGLPRCHWSLSLM